MAHENPFHHIDAAISEEKFQNIAIKDLTTILKALISTYSASMNSNQGRYIADKVPYFIDKVKNLLNISSNKPDWNPKTLWQIKIALADSLSLLGDQAGLNKPLNEAINYYQEFLKTAITLDDPLEWARIQNNLGNALGRQGQKDTSHMTNLEGSVKAYKAALTVWTKEKTPWNWAMAKSNLGLTYTMLGSQYYQKALAAYYEAFEVWTKENYALGWATIQNNLGNAFLQQHDITNIEKAITAYNKALTVRTKNNVLYIGLLPKTI